ncbi:MAG: recombination protein O N-terminal domain-containing protein [Bacteroidales bacterium]|nr:recombination protein O N-terminal domain-containing protein [Bacteroidales bacterium]
MIINTPLIVLHTTKFGENSLVIHTLSRDYGRRSFLVRGVGNKSSMSLFLPLTLLDADIIENSRSDLYTARNLSASCPLLGIRNNIYKNSMTMFMSEVLYRVVKDGSAEPGMYEWCEKNIMLLNAIQTDFSNFHIRFLLELCVTLGFSPESCDLKPFAGSHYSLIEHFMKCSFAESMLIPLTGVTRNEIAEEILRYIEFHTESTLNINSLKVLRDLYV